MAKFPSKAPSKFAPTAHAGSAGKKISPLTTGSGRTSGNASKVYSVSAPAKPKMASMKSAHGKLVRGDF